MYALVATVCLYLASPAIIAGDRITYYVSDALGSAVAAFDELGTVVGRAGYLPYGETIAESGEEPTNSIDRVGFTGHVHDDTGLVYMGARYFDPVAGRFMGMDPVGFDEANPQSFNRYQYANNNPYRYVDPNGQEAIPFNDDPTLKPGIGTLIVGGAIGAVAAAPAVYSSMAIVALTTELAASEVGFTGLTLGMSASFVARVDGDQVARGLLSNVGSILGKRDDIVVLGRQLDTAVAKHWSGHVILDLPPEKWSLNANDAFIAAVIQQRRRVYLASPITAENVYDAVGTRSTVFGREIDQLLDAGYKRRGDYFEPPNTAR